MSHPGDFASRFDRRALLRRAAGMTALAAGGFTASRALAEPLDDLLGDTDRGDFGQEFDQASRTIHMPKATAPTLSPATAQFTANRGQDL